MRFFTTEGPVNCADHYCLPPLALFLELAELLTLIDQKKYFLLHAPRQTGKTTCLLALAETLNREGRYRAVYANIEGAQAYRENVDKGMATAVTDIFPAWAQDLTGDTVALDPARAASAQTPHGSAFGVFLTRWCSQLSQPLVLLLDEVDALVGDTLISLLRQLRAGYPKRPTLFAETVILCGVRDLQDYRIHSSSEKSVITGGSAFNIKAKSLRLAIFSQRGTATLLLEHTQETGQVFHAGSSRPGVGIDSGAALAVNALAYTACFELESGRERSQPITAEQIQVAREQLILSVLRIWTSWLTSSKSHGCGAWRSRCCGVRSEDEDTTRYDFQYVLDLGLEPGRGRPPDRQSHLPGGDPAGIDPDRPVEPGSAAADRLVCTPQRAARPAQAVGCLSALLSREFRSLGGALRLQGGRAAIALAVLQRIVNGGGRVEREYGLGRGRTDLLVVWFHPDGVQRVVIELKLLYKSLAATLAEGLRQTWEYADRCGAAEAHLVIFDRRADRSWDERIWQRSERHNELPITVWGM